METYVLSFSIWDARGLVTADGGQVDPYVEVTCCDKRWLSEIELGKQQIVTWNANHIWNDIKLYPEQFKTAFLEIKVYARNWFLRDDLIGSCSLQLHSINTRKNHVYAKKWMVLRTGDDPEPKGMIRVTTFCLKPGDPPPSGEQQEGVGGEAEEGGGGEDAMDLSKAVLGELDTSAVDGRPQHVLVTIYRVEDLPLKESWFDANNPFVTVEFAGACIQSQIARNSASFAYNEVARIPVMAVFEDTVLVKLWNYNFGSPDQLLAQGMLSFSELRNRPLLPRWFNFYGWNQDEVDLVDIASSGEMIPENVFLGRVLVSARIEKLSDPEDLQPAKMIPATIQMEEPPQMQVALLVDVYQVSGVFGRECMVEVCFGNAKPQECKEWLAVDSPLKAKQRKGDVPDTEAAEEEVPTFLFKHPQKGHMGRIPPAVTMVPEDPVSQFKIFVNVYTRGLVSNRQRVAFMSCDLKDIAKHEDGAAPVPKFFRLTGIPGMGTSVASSILLTMQQAKKDDVARPAPKSVIPGPYLVRAYIYGARNVVYDKTAIPNLELTFNCAGVSKSTGLIPGTASPRWMKCVPLRITLLADDPNSDPTMEQIVCVLSHKSQVAGITVSSKEIGRATCDYTYMRRKDVLEKWEPFAANPQWVKFFGGQHGEKTDTTYRGDVLIAFEMMLARPAIIKELVPQEMWPVGKMKEVTLHFALLGLRDLAAMSALAGLLTSEVSPSAVRVIVRVANLDKDTAAEKPWSGEPLIFKFSDVKVGGNPQQKADKNKSWVVNSRASMEILEVKSMHCLVANMPVLDQCLHIEVKTMGAFDSDELRDGTLIGEARIPINKRLPWYKPADDDLTAAMHEYQEPTKRERDALAKELKEKLLAEKKKGLKLSNDQDDVVEAVNSAGLPATLLETGYKDRLEYPYTYPLDLWGESLNMQKSHIKIEISAPTPKVAESAGRPAAKFGLLENEMDDFYFRQVPLQRGIEMHPSRLQHDLVRLSELDGTFGFVKCAFYFEEGYQPLKQDQKKEEDEDAMPESSAPVGAGNTEDSEVSVPRMSQDMHEDLLELFDQDVFRDRYKNEDYLPPRLRVRLYVVKANIVFTKGGEAFPDPFFDTQLGGDIHISGRNNFVANSCQPGFYRIEERDISMPNESRLELTMKCYEELGLGDPVIGSTMIDLEDRWHSNKWKLKMEQGFVPVENRALWRRGDKETGGTVEMWIELVDSFRASEFPPSPLRAPPPNEIEMRLVIWGTKDIKLMDGKSTDVMFKVALDCSAYSETRVGAYPRAQDTDVHYGCDDGKSVFNWRIVYPRIIMPVQSALMQITVFNYSLIGGNTFLGELNLDVKKYLEQVNANAERLDMEHTFLPIKWPDQEADPDPGFVEVSLTVLMQQEANGNGVGKARDEPNQDPQLITPIDGRGWGDFLKGFGFNFALPNWQKFVAIIVLGVLGALVVLKQVGLL